METHQPPMFRFTAEDREYANWSIEPPYPGPLDPVALRLLSGDQVDNRGRIVAPSPFRSQVSIPGVLCLSKGSHGRRGKRLDYMCVPFDKHLPVFLVPYAPKKASFCKKPVDLYILFKVHEWRAKHPYGLSTNTLGQVSSLSATYEFLSHAHAVHVPIQKLTRAAFNAIRSCPLGVHGLEREAADSVPAPPYECPDLVTIDPVGATDLDDAIGASPLEGGGFKVAVAITDPSYWLDRLCLWPHLTDKVCTLYLPDAKKPMLPGAALSDGLCSLKADAPRPCLVLLVELTEEGKLIREDLACLCCRIKANEIYESNSLVESDRYQTLFRATRTANDTFHLQESLVDSHEVVSFWMTWFNLSVAKKLDGLGTGIYRTGPSCPPVANMNSRIPVAAARASAFWGRGGGRYTKWEERAHHKGIADGTRLYAQSTSPIRRVVDLVNVVCLLHGLGLRALSPSALGWADHWLERVPAIQSYTRAARRVQSECELLSLCSSAHQGGDVEFDGYPIDQGEDEGEAGGRRYLVHVPRLRNMVRVHTDAPLALLERVRLRLHLFLDEAAMHRKVRVTVCTP